MTRQEMLAQLNAGATTAPAISAGSRTEMLDQLKRQEALAKLQAQPQPEFGKGDLNPVAENNIAENALIGMGQSFYKAGKGVQELYNMATGDDEKVAQLRADEAQRRQLDEPLMNTWGGNIGNIAGEGAMLALPGGAVAKGAKGIKSAMALEAMLGAGMGALKPTVEGESRGGNMAEGAAWGAAIPAAGAVLRSEPVKKTADLLLDWNPFFRRGRLDVKNAAGAEAHRLDKARQIADVETANDISRNSWASQEEANKAFLESEAKRVKDESLARTAQLTAAELRRAGGEEAKRLAAESAAREEITKRAGWSATPKNKLELEARVGEVGKVYGEMLDKTALDMSTTVPDILKLAQEGGLASGEAAKLASIANRFASSADKSGFAPGQMYKTLRAELTSELEDARGLYRDQLRAAIGSMDESLKNTLDPDTLKSIEAMRKQYSLGKKLEKVPFDPSKPFDPWKAQARLDVTGDATGTRQYLTDFAAKTPKKPINPAIIDPVPEAPIAGTVPVPPPVIREVPYMPKFKAKPYDWGKLAALHGVLGLSTGGISHLALPPLLVSANKLAKSENARKATAAALRALNANTIGNEEPPPLMITRGR